MGSWRGSLPDSLDLSGARLGEAQVRDNQRGIHGTPYSDAPEIHGSAKMKHHVKNMVAILMKISEVHRLRTLLFQMYACKQNN